LNNSERTGRLQRITDSLVLYGVTDRMWLQTPFPADDPLGIRQLAANVESCIAGGTTMIQLREKNVAHDQVVAIARAVQAVCSACSIPFVVDDDVDLMLELDADGVHVGQHDCAADEVRRRIGGRKLLGVSVQTPEQAVKAEASGADYLGTGAVFSTSTKPDADTVTAAQLAAVCGAVTIPVVAIGGINNRTVKSLAGTGIAGAAVISALFSAADKTASARNLRSVCNGFAETCTVVERAQKAEHNRALFTARMKAAVFDMDGTLLDSMPMWHTAGRRFLESRGIPAEPGLWDDIKQLDMEQTARYFMNRYGMKDSIGSIIAGMNRTIFEQYENVLLLKPGVLSFLQELESRSIPVALATATDRVCVEACFNRLGISRYFQSVITCTEAGAGKESPLVYENAQALLGTPRAQTCVFEDAIHAAGTAKKAGFPVCAVYDESSLESQDWFRLQNSADCYCFSLSDLL
jgi:thiamine-phosphate diphosphorylase